MHLERQVGRGCGRPWTQRPHLLTHPMGPERIRGVVRSESIRVAGAGTNNHQARVNSNGAFSRPRSAKPQLLLLRARSRLVSTEQSYLGTHSRHSRLGWRGASRGPGGHQELAVGVEPGQTQAPASSELLLAEAFCMDRGPREGAPRACGPPGWEGVCRRVRGPEA